MLAWWPKTHSGEILSAYNSKVLNCYCKFIFAIVRTWKGSNREALYIYLFCEEYD